MVKAQRSGRRTNSRRRGSPESLEQSATRGAACCGREDSCARGSGSDHQSLALRFAQVQTRIGLHGVFRIKGDPATVIVGSPSVDHNIAQILQFANETVAVKYSIRRYGPPYILQGDTFEATMKRQTIQNQVLGRTREAAQQSRERSFHVVQTPRGEQTIRTIGFFEL